MPTFQAIVSVLIAGFALSATPGPSMLYVLSHSIGQSRAAGLASAFGLCIGGMILAVATALGLAALFNTFEWLVIALRYIGSIYLTWLGVEMIVNARRASRENLQISEIERTKTVHIVWRGIIVELMNPKTVLFFALFIPPFVNLNSAGPENSSITLQLLILGSLVPLTAVPSDILVALLGSHLAKTLRQNSLAREALSWLGGLLLILIAISLHAHLY